MLLIKIITEIKFPKFHSSYTPYQKLPIMQAAIKSYNILWRIQDVFATPLMIHFSKNRNRYPEMTLADGNINHVRRIKFFLASQICRKYVAVFFISLTLNDLLMSQRKVNMAQVSLEIRPLQWWSER